jgi:hypothetical protein
MARAFSKHTTTFVANQSYEQKRHQKNEWFYRINLLAGLIPLQNDSSYTINQIKKVKNNVVDASFKDYSDYK